MQEADAWLEQVLEPTDPTESEERWKARVKEAIKAKLLAHPEQCAEFVATRPRTIVHETGFPESRFTQLPAAVFCRILTELREELHQLVT